MRSVYKRWIALFFMFYTNHSVAALESIFGQRKSVIHADVKFIAQQIMHTMGTEWLSLHEADTVKYNDLLGQGVFTDGEDTIFGNVGKYIKTTAT